MEENEIIKKVGWIRDLIFISMNAMAFLFAYRYEFGMMLIHVLASVIVSYYLIYKKRIIEKIFAGGTSLLNCIYSLILTLVIVSVYNKKFYYALLISSYKMRAVLKISYIFYEISTKVIWRFVLIFACFSIFIFLYAFNKKILEIVNKERKEIDKIEKRYLLIISIVFGFAIAMIFSVTNVFYSPSQDGTIIDYDVIYTTDTGNQFKENVLLSISASENDIRQPLFAIFTMPFAAGAYLISKVLFFIPNIYMILIAFMQIVLMGYMYILVARMLKLESIEKLLFFVLITFSYPFLLFAINIEQYVFSTFWLVMFIYSSLTDRKNIDYLYIASTGSMMTSGIYFFLLSKAKNVKEWLKDIFTVASKFLSVVVLSGQFIIFILMTDSLQTLTRFSGVDISFENKFLQFLNFVATCFIAPPTTIDMAKYEYASWQLAPINTINLLDGILLLMVITGFVLNKKEPFVKICMSWVVFSFIILCVVGWGTRENGLVLYSFYFSWAYISLAVALIKKILKEKKIRNAVYISIIFIEVLINIPSLYELLMFGIKYYPIAI